MDKRVLDRNLEQAAKTIYTYCQVRTSTREEAEDLSQDILLEIMKSACNLRDDKAFYGFMWAIAGNVYKNWCKKRNRASYALLDENLSDQSEGIDKQIEKNSDISLLRRELSLLTEQYRKCAVLYYVDAYPVAKIAKTLDISESMVKYLLFKTRKILKEGMNMLRNYGEQSYNPRKLELLYMGEGPNQFWDLISSKKIPQNILWACYNDSLTEEEISLQIGVAVPYLEEYIASLTKAGLLIRKGSKYSTNIIIFTNQFISELESKNSALINEMADKLYTFIINNEDKIRSIDYRGSKMSRNSFIWNVSIISLQMLFARIRAKFSATNPPVTAFGERAYVWGCEEADSACAICTMSPNDGSLKEGELRLLDYIPSSKTRHADFYCNKKLADFLIKLASNKVTNPDEYEKQYIADLIRLGYAFNDNGKIKVTLPVFTKEQINQVDSFLNPVVDDLLTLSAKVKEMTDNILRNHVPSHLKDQVNDITCMRMFDDIIGGITKKMVNKYYLKTDWEANEIPTYYAVIDE